MMLFVMLFIAVPIICFFAAYIFFGKLHMAIMGCLLTFLFFAVDAAFQNQADKIEDLQQFIEESCATIKT